MCGVGRRGTLAGGVAATLIDYDSLFDDTFVNAFEVRPWQKLFATVNEAISLKKRG